MAHLLKFWWKPGTTNLPLLKDGIYRFRPVKRVLIPKGGSNKMRKLGIPVIMDRIVSQSINLVFIEIFDQDFTESNYGFRRGHSQHQAIYHVQDIIKEWYEWCASVDLASFFDEIPHSLILKLIRRKIQDEKLDINIMKLNEFGCE